MSRPETLAGNQRPVQSDWKTKFSAIFALNSSTDYIHPRILEFTVLGLKIESVALFHLRASKVFGKCFKLFRRVIEVGKSEKIIKIGPETAEISKKHPKSGLKQAKFGDFKIGSKF